MELTYAGLREQKAWEQAGIILPSYDVEAVAERTMQNPGWVHFGIGNIFRVFIGGIADRLLNEGAMDTGLTCVETFDHEIVDRMYAPYDNLALSVILKGDGSREMRVLGSMAETVKADTERADDWKRLKEIFSAPSLQMVSFTITEKGYSLRDADGAYFKAIFRDFDLGPEAGKSAMAILTSMLLTRFRAGALPVALVSMDNVSQNGKKLQESVLTVAKEWKSRGYVDEAFLAYLQDPSKVTFPWTMIDKITPRPSEKIASELEALGLPDMHPIVTGGKTFIAPFINAEGPQYLVIEDTFPNGRPQLEQAGVYLADRETVNKSERMKVTACLNPVHSALGPYGCVLGYDLFSDEMRDPLMHKLAEVVGYREGLEVAPDPGILSPKAFLDELMQDRFPNPYLGDTTDRLAVDMSQIVGIRFGETIKAFVEKYGDAKKLIGLPLAIAGWMRYLMAVRDDGTPFTLAYDPMNDQLTRQLEGLHFGEPASLTDQIRPILSNTEIFRIDLYQAGIGERIEEILREEMAGPGAVRRTLEKYLMSEEN